MNKQLPKPIELYIGSLNTSDNSVIDACMAKDAHVHDIDQDSHINGLEAIKKWRGDVSGEFNLKLKPQTRKTNTG